MPRFAANLGMMFTEVPFLDRFAQAAEAGFEAVEFAFPYETSSPEQVAAALQASGLKQTLFNVAPGDRSRGDRGLAAVPGREAEFAAALDVSLEYAKAGKVGAVHLMAGTIREGADVAEMERAYKSNVIKAADFFAPHGVAVCLEPLNRESAPGYFLRTLAQAVGYIETLGHPNVKLQFDFFHAQMEEGGVSRKFREYYKYIGHIQFAGAPDRHEPDQGELNYPYLFDLIDSMGWTGYVGAEYAPAGNTRDGLGWFRAYGTKSPAPQP